MARRWILATLLAVALSACGGGDGVPGPVGQYSIEWDLFSPGHPDWDGAEILPDSGPQFEYGILWTKTGSLESSNGCNLDGDCLACDSDVSLCVSDGAWVGSIPDPNGGSWGFALRAR